MTKLDKVFRTVSSAYLKEFIPGNACPDQYVADLDRGAIHFSRESANQALTGLAPVILIIESPHNEEYSDPDHPVPANGRTGEGIQKHLWSVLKRLRFANFIGRPLILANAIRYQCSLGGCGKQGIATSFHRDSMFVRMWAHKAIRDDFHTRLLLYVGSHQPFSNQHRKGYVIINACTKGKTERQLRMSVEDEVIAALKRQSHITVEHPSNWKPGVRIRGWRYVADALPTPSRARQRR